MKITKLENLLEFQSYEMYDLLSFDMFGTLVKRQVSTPSDVFREAAKRYYNDEHLAQYFEKKRCLVEKSQKHKFGETSINQIYEELIKIFGSEVEIIKNLELKVEYDTLIPNLPVVNFYEKISANKEIVIVSDMYYDALTLRRMLYQVTGIDCEKLFASVDFCKTKSSGKLWKLLINSELNGKKILHIGDSPKGDLIFPILNRIDSIYISGINNYVYVRR